MAPYRITSTLTVCCQGVQSNLMPKKFATVKRWIGENGGCVHDSLKLHQQRRAPYWVLRTTTDLTLEDMDIPAIVLPSSIIINRQTALEDLEDVLAKAGCPPIYGRSTAEVLMIFIAYHKKQGTESIWYPLIDCLPETPPCPWLRQIRDLPEIEYDEEIQKVILDEKSGNDLMIRSMKTVYGDVLGIPSVDLLWAYAQTQSVLLHDQEGSFWPPLVNFVVHDPSYPPLFIVEGGKFVSWGKHGAKPLKAGEELRMNIGIESSLLLYLSRGIVSPDL